MTVEGILETRQVSRKGEARPFGCRVYMFRVLRLRVWVLRAVAIRGGGAKSAWYDQWLDSSDYPDGKPLLILSLILCTTIW